VLDWAATHNVAVVPFGGGTSVVGGVEPVVGDSYARQSRWTWNAWTGAGG